MTPPTVVYTDGACSGNPGPGGWAWVVPDGPQASGGEPETTNQRMELTAVLDAVRTLEGPLEIVSDSTYVVNCFRDRWWEGWLARDWLNSQKKPVANRDLWEPLVEEYQRRKLTFRWVKGHSGDRWNDVADRLAVEAASSQQGHRTGGDPPASAPRPRDVEGHVVLVTGHRPPELGGYADNPVRTAVRERLEAILAAKAEMHPDLVVITGLGLGAESLGAEASTGAGVPYEAILAFPDSDSRWPDESRRAFGRLVDGARQARVLEKKTPDTNQKVAGSFRRRDAWMRRNADEAVVVWDGKDGLLGKVVRTLNDELGEENVWVVEPESVG